MRKLLVRKCAKKFLNDQRHLRAVEIVSVEQLYLFLPLFYFTFFNVNVIFFVNFSASVSRNMFRFSLKSNLLVRSANVRNVVKCEFQRKISMNHTKRPTPLFVRPTSPKPLAVSRFELIRTREFRTTQCQRTPKLILLMIRPIASIVSGRLFRRWWQKKDKEERAKYSGWFYRNKSRILTGVGFYFASVVVYYLYNIEETPMTRRKRFMAFTSDQLVQINKEAALAMTSNFTG